MWVSAVSLSLLLLSLRHPGESHAQPVPPQSAPSIAALVARSIRSSGNDGRSLPILTQAKGKERRELMDEIADTLVALAINPAEETLANSRARSVAIAHLFLAGKGNTGLADEVRGVPYSGAALRLRRIVESSAHDAVRQGALMRLSELEDSRSMLAYLRQCALWPNNVAATAVTVLADEKGAAGLAIARTLYESGSIKNAYAKRVLSTRAYKYGWRGQG